MTDDGCPSPESEKNLLRVNRPRRGLPMLVVRDTLEQGETHAEMTPVQEGAGDE